MSGPARHRPTAPAVAAFALLLVAAGWSGLWARGALAAEPAGDASSEEPLSERLKGRDPEALAELREAFRISESKVEKQRLATILVALEQGDEYFRYLAAEARRALERDMPFPLELDAEGQVVPQQLSAEFQEWAQAEGVDAAASARQALYELPGDLLFLGLSRDPRGEEILLEGLGSRNYMVAYRAAEALARIGAVDAVPAILEAAQAAPGQFPTLLARALLLFDDPEAQEAAAGLIGDPRAVAELRRRARSEKRQIEDDLSNLQR